MCIRMHNPNGEYYSNDKIKMDTLCLFKIELFVQEYISIVL